MASEYKNLAILPVKITVDSHGAVSVQSKITDKEYKRIVGIAITYDDTTNLLGSTINFTIGGKALFKHEVEIPLFTFNSACPVNERFFNLLEIPVDNSSIEIAYTPSANLPVGDTVITVSFQCTFD